MAKEERMPSKSFGLLKLIAIERSKNKAARTLVKSITSHPSGSGLLDYVEMPIVDDEILKTKKKKLRRRVCHPVVVIGLVTLILYVIFMTFLIGYFHVPKIKAVLDSLKRLANIKEWLRIIFKPWYNTGGKNDGSEAVRSIEESRIGTYLNPEFDVNIK